MRVDAPSRESFNEAMLSLNSAQFVEIRLIYKNMRPQTQTQKISLRLTPLLQICAQKSRKEYRCTLSGSPCPTRAWDNSHNK